MTSNINHSFCIFYKNNERGLAYKKSLLITMYYFTFPITKTMLVFVQNLPKIPQML